MEKWTLYLSLENNFGKKYTRAITLDPSITLQTSAPDPFEDNFDSTVRKMKKREARKHVLSKTGHQLGLGLADFLEDMEGWHGEERQQAILREERK